MDNSVGGSSHGEQQQIIDDGAALLESTPVAATGTSGNNNSSISHPEGKSSVVSDKPAKKASFNRLKHQLQSELGALNREKEQHNVRLHNLRKELNHIKASDWQYDPIEKLIGRGNQ